MPRMPKRHYVLALACYLSIPVVLIAGAGLFRLIDPEMARSHADYVRDYRLLELARLGAMMVASGAALVLWASTCYLSGDRVPAGDKGERQMALGVRRECVGPRSIT